MAQTSLISILCGLTTPTSGVGYVGRHEIPRDVDVIYESMGYCPQHDILWDDLSVQEHIMYARAARLVIPARISLLISRTGNARSIQLLLPLAQPVRVPRKERNRPLVAPGQSARLSRQARVRALRWYEAPLVALDLNGRLAQVRAARRAHHRSRSGFEASHLGSYQRGQGMLLLLLLLCCCHLAATHSQLVTQHDRCILLTTHNMEEADTLCHRIGIMSQGRLRCIGTQLDLKHRFGLGYKLSVTTTHQETATEFVMSLFPAATLETVFSGTLTFQIETGFDLSTLFTAMKNKADYHITSWAVNQTSLEDVFLRIVRMEEDEAAAAAAAAAAE